VRDFVISFERELTAAIRRHEEHPTHRKRGLIRRWPIAVAMACAIAIFVLVAVSAERNDGRAQALPLLERPSQDASSLSAHAPLLRAHNAEFAEARTFASPTGTAYLIPTKSGGYCLAVPDPVDGYGQSCSTTEEIAQRGLIIVMVPPQGGEVTLVAVLPTDARSARLTTIDGEPVRALDQGTDGVVTATVTREAVFHVSIADHDVTARLPAQGLCPGGHFEPAPPQPGDAARGNPQRERCLPG
jgi:hypothetical protein